MLAKPLYKLFHRFSAFVQPIPKKGESSSPSNYQPIALAFLLSKVIETLINYQFKKYLEDRKLLNDRQYSFQSNRSTGDLMVHLTKQLSKSTSS